MKHSLFVAGLVISLVISGMALPGLAAAQISKQEAASIAKTQFKGRVIGVKAEGDENAPVYHVKILDKSGGIHLVIVNGQDGKIISAH